MLRAEDNGQEYRLKAAFLVNFARFITWPEQAFTPGHKEFTLCVVGDNPFGTALKGVEAKKIGGRDMRVVFFDSFGNISQCHLIYVSSSEKHKLNELITGLGKQPVVTVSDISGFIKAGGSIEFVTQEDRLGFIINHSAMKQRGLQASASMLDLAKSVR